MDFILKPDPARPLVPWQFTDWLSGIFGTEQMKLRIKCLSFSSVISSPVTETPDGGDWQGPLEVQLPVQAGCSEPFPDGF